MSLSVTFNGTTYTLPTTGDVDWGNQLALFLAAVGTSVVAIATSSVGQGFANSSTLTQLNFNTVEADTHSAFTTGSASKFTAPLAGYYQVDCSVHFNGVTVGDSVDMLLSCFVNGALKSRLARFDSNSTQASPGLSGATVVFLNKGDTLDVRLSQTCTSGSTYSLSTNTAAVRVAIHRV
jgi:hypothetical protein